MKKRLSIKGMSCEKCSGHVLTALKEVNGVGSVVVDLEGGSAEVEVGGKVENQDLVKAIKESGYEVTEIEDVM